jgi:hypothetical protein
MHLEPSAHGGLRERLQATLDRTQAFMLREDFRGYDPYDALKSPLARISWLPGGRLCRRILQQGVRRLPFQVRPLLGIAKGRNPVTLALAAQGFTYRARGNGTDREVVVARVSDLVRRLRAAASPGFSGACWGYDFDWEAMSATLPAGYPTIVATGFVTNALFQVHRYLGLEEAGELVEAALPFLLEDIHRIPVPGGFCWSYSPADRAVVPNATMKGARLCAQAYGLTGRQELLVPARETIAFVTRQQRSDGAWPYAIGDPRAWVDSFHTCYILDCLHEYERITGDRQFQEPLQRGWDYFARQFLLADGRVRYYDRRLHPIDATACAQAILTTLRFGEPELAARIADWSLTHLAKPDGTFRYQIHSWYRNSLTYMRWSVAWMFAALSRLEWHLEQAPQGRASMIP